MGRQGGERATTRCRTAAPPRWRSWRPSRTRGL